MRQAIKRSIDRLFPEIAGGYHVPRHARIVGIADTPGKGDIADNFRPHYAVDLQVLDANGNDDSRVPVLRSVPLPAPMAGNESGQFGYPQRGTLVTMGFAYGSPNSPMIYSVMPCDNSLPKVADGEQLWQQSDSTGQRADQDGKWSRWSDSDIKDEALRYLLDAMEKIETLHKSNTTVETHSTETVHGVKKIMAMGALKLLSGGSLAIGAIDNLAITAASDLNENVARDRLSAIAGSLSMIAGTKAHIESGACYIGDSTNNLFKMVSDLCQAFINLADAYALHTHGGVFPGGASTTIPSNAATAAAESVAATTTKTDVDTMTE